MLLLQASYINYHMRTMNTLKIVFSGIGAVGGYYGGMLAVRCQVTAKANVYFISRGENLKAIRENGLQIKNGFQTIRAVPTLATDSPKEIGPVDYLFCCTKSYDLEENLKQLLPVIDGNTVLIPLLNGLDIEERIHRILPDQQVWKGCVYIGSHLDAPGVVNKYSEKERLFFGNNTADRERQTELLKLLVDAGINAFNPDDIDARIWEKFFMISIIATATSFFNQPADEIVSKHKDIYFTLCSELKSLAEKMDIRLPEDIAYTSIETLKMMPAGATTSMHTDYLAGRKTELESLTGYVIRQADRLGVQVPFYRQMYNTLKTRTINH